MNFEIDRLTNIEVTGEYKTKSNENRRDQRTKVEDDGLKTKEKRGGWKSEGALF